MDDQVEKTTEADEVRLLGLALSLEGDAAKAKRAAQREQDAAAIRRLLERISRAEGALREIDSLEVMELNPSNYDHDEVCELNNNASQASVIAQQYFEPPTNPVEGEKS